MASEDVRSLTREVGKFGYKCVKKVKDDERAATDYKRQARRLPAMILQNGLGQALSFLLSLSNDNKGAEQLYRDISQWLRERDIYSKKGDVVGQIMEGDMDQYIRAQEMTLTLLDALSRFAEAFIEDTGGTEE